MEDHVPLPASVEQVLTTICERHSISPPDVVGAKRQLASLGEEDSLTILRKISNSTHIRTLTGYIIYMTKSARGESNWSPTSRPSTSGGGTPFSSPSPGKSISTPPTCPSPSGSGTPFSASSPGVMRRQTSRAVTSLWGASSSARLPRSYSMALAELDFKKAFLILSYAGKERLESVITADDIYKFKNSQNATFESEVWHSIGRHCIEEKDRREVHLMKFDSDHGGAFLYHCVVDSNGNYSFKGPYYDKMRTHLQKVLGDDNVLMVKFSEEEDAKGKFSATSSCTSSYKKIAEEGIFVGLRHYRFFVFKDGGKEEKKKDPTSSCVKCYFVCMESNALLDRMRPCPLYSKSVHDARCVFMHVHKVSSLVGYMKRFSLILSKTIKLDVDFGSLVVQTIDDEPCKDDNGGAVRDEDGKPLVHTDGTGFISEDLALKCPRNIFKGTYRNQGDIKETRALTELEQIFGQSKSNIEDPVRLFYNGRAVKGTLLVNKYLPFETIQIRPSMIKVERDHELKIPTVNSLEIVSTSPRPRKAYLSRSLISHL
ncbi:probable RNA-dependent RNA polymerase 3, partial [Macadamia integrifolia]|uniref:probable RNA-dependent RNA polymerase 3 n=1 Tax=Macadamia integrifolia TaxID=60698 RepID=UPI001C4FF3B5